METEILKAVTTAKEATKEKGEARVLLVLDGLDFPLAATGCTALEIMDLVGAVREVWLPYLPFYLSNILKSANILLLTIARPLHHPNLLRRPPLHSIPHHTARDLAHGFRDGYGASGVENYECERIRYGGCQGRKRSLKNL